MDIAFVLLILLRRVAEESPDKLLAAMVQVLPKDFQVSIANESTARWVINAKPLTPPEWMQEHGLDVIESPSMLEIDQ